MQTASSYWAQIVKLTFFAVIATAFSSEAYASSVAQRNQDGNPLFLIEATDGFISKFSRYASSSQLLCVNKIMPGNWRLCGRVQPVLSARIVRITNDAKECEIDIDGTFRVLNAQARKGLAVGFVNGEIQITGKLCFVKQNQQLKLDWNTVRVHRNALNVRLCKPDGIDVSRAARRRINCRMLEIQIGEAFCAQFNQDWTKEFSSAGSAFTNFVVDKKIRTSIGVSKGNLRFAATTQPDRLGKLQDVKTLNEEENSLTLTIGNRFLLEIVKLQYEKLGEDKNKKMSELETEFFNIKKADVQLNGVNIAGDENYSTITFEFNKPAKNFALNLFKEDGKFMVKGLGDKKNEPKVLGSLIDLLDDNVDKKTAGLLKRIKITNIAAKDNSLQVIFEIE